MEKLLWWSEKLERFWTDALWKPIRAAIDTMGLPAWVSLLVVFVVLTGVVTAYASVMMSLMTWVERKAIGRFQNRYGPNRVGLNFLMEIPLLRPIWNILVKIPVIGPPIAGGLFGLGQPIADGLKLLTKEDIVPESADKVLHALAPIVILFPSLLIFVVLPHGDGMVPVDLGIGLLFLLAVTSTTTLGIFMAGWASRNKFAMLGAMRAVAQMVSYEIPMVISGLAVVMVAGSLSLVDIVDFQGGRLFHAIPVEGIDWIVLKPWGFLAFTVFFICSIAEVNRPPFDLAEAESEIIAGFHTEFSGFKFAVISMGEFVACYAMCMLTVVLFFGGWHGPAILGVTLPSWLWMFVKTWTVYFFFVWMRATFPRLRVDQLMGLAWKFLLPLALANIAVTAIWVRTERFMIRWPVGLLLVVAAFLLISRVNRHKTVRLDREYVFAD